MKTLFLLLIGISLIACTEQDPTVKSEDQLNIEPKKTENTEVEQSKPESIEPEVIVSKQMKNFQGNWFKVTYPANFKASPNSPVEKMEDYSFVRTDEATFVSQDGSVEFFVYSPQWAGDPIEYLKKRSNEKITSDKTQKGDSDDPFSIAHRWVTFEDVDGKYVRCYHSQRAESTHHVFGVKYTNIKMYEVYKAAYLAFKKSLEQYAD